jgi:DNA-binding beta-propeller fold protein YncE
MSQYGTPGTEIGSFSALYGIAIDNENNIYTSEQGTNRIQKFDCNFNFILTWGSTGTEDDQLKTPMSIDIDSENNVYVLDSYNHYVKKFDKNGNFLLKFGGKGYDIDQLGNTFNNYLPHGLCVDKKNNVYVSYDYFGSRVSKFTSNGFFISRFSTNSNQAGLAIDDDLYIYHSYFKASGVEIYDGGIKVFTQNGTIKYSLVKELHFLM